MSEQKAEELVNRAFHMLLKHTVSTSGELQNDIIGAMGLLESAEYLISAKDAEIERVKGLLKEEVLSAYDSLTSVRQARYRGAEDYADRVFKDLGL